MFIGYGTADWWDALEKKRAEVRAKNPGAKLCTRCGGTTVYRHHGVCFRCGGSGVDPKQPKAKKGGK